MVVTLAAAWVAPSLAAPAGPLVTITGGAVPGTECGTYKWTVTNHYPSPIVYIKFPHYRADTFHAPAGWATETTYLVNVGVPDRPGVCIARAEPPNPGIPRGSARQFGMGMTAARAVLGKGTVTVRFADGTETKVADVELPRPFEPGAKYIPLIGGAVLFAGWVIVRTLRRRSPAPDVGTGERWTNDHT